MDQFQISKMLNMNNLQDILSPGKVNAMKVSRYIDFC